MTDNLDHLLEMRDRRGQMLGSDDAKLDTKLSRILARLREI